MNAKSFDNYCTLKYDFYWSSVGKIENNLANNEAIYNKKHHRMPCFVLMAPNQLLKRLILKKNISTKNISSSAIYINGLSSILFNVLFISLVYKLS